MTPSTSVQISIRSTSSITPISEDEPRNHRNPGRRGDPLANAGRGACRIDPRAAEGVVRQKKVARVDGVGLDAGGTQSRSEERARDPFAEREDAVEAAGRALSHDRDAAQDFTNVVGPTPDAGGEPLALVRGNHGLQDGPMTRVDAVERLRVRELSGGGRPCRLGQELGHAPERGHDDHEPRRSGGRPLGTDDLDRGAHPIGGRDGAAAELEDAILLSGWVHVLSGAGAVPSGRPSVPCGSGVGNGEKT
jgi:hypothetical protein